MKSKKINSGVRRRVVRVFRRKIMVDSAAYNVTSERVRRRTFLDMAPDRLDEDTDRTALAQVTRK
jgi:hypothetical protein